MRPVPRYVRVRRCRRQRLQGEVRGRHRRQKIPAAGRLRRHLQEAESDRVHAGARGQGHHRCLGRKIVVHNVEYTVLVRTCKIYVRTINLNLLEYKKEAAQFLSTDYWHINFKT